MSGYLVKRYDAGTLAPQTVLTACTGTVTATSCVENNVPNGSWKYAVTPVFATNWQGPESAKSATVNVVSDATPPTNSISLSSVSGGAFLSGTTVYYRGSAAGSLRLTNAVADAGSGPASSATATLSGTTTGWTHSPSTVSTPSGGPYVSNPFSWTAGTTSGPGEAVTGRDVAGNSAVTNLTFTNDSTAPTAGTITYADGFTSGASVSISFTTGTDAGSGIATRRLQRAVATLNGTACATFGSFTDIGADGPASPYVDGSLQHGCYQYRYVVTDRVGNQHVATSANVVKVSYAGAVDATPGLLSHWRLGEASASLISSDSFNGTSGTALTTRAGEIGASWVNPSGNSNMIIGTQNRAYRNASGYSIMYASGTPSSADYSVEADLHYRGAFSNNAAGVIGRFNTSNTSFYMARWENDNTWNIVKWANGAPAWLGVTAVQPGLTVGHSYRVRLEMSGTTTTTLKLYVNGVQMLSVADSSSPFTAVGKAGLMAGETGDPAQTDATGIQFENFQVHSSTYPRAADSKGSNTGDYKNGVTLGAPGALSAGTNTAATFDGVNDYVQMTGTTGLPTGAALRSTEMWFKTTSSARSVLFRYGSGANTQEYGLWIDAGGTQMTAWGFGGGNDKVFTMPSAVNNGAWHHVVMTYNGTSITLYIDGVALPAQAATRNTAMDQYGFGIGAIVRPNDGNSGGFFQRVDRRGLLLHHGADTDPGHRPLPARRRAVRRRERAHRRLRRRHRPDRDGVALLDVDDVEPRAGQGHRPERHRHLGQPGPACDRDPHRRHVRHLRLLHPGLRRQRPRVAARRLGRRPGLLQLPVRRAGHAGQRHDVHQPRHQGRHHRAGGTEPRVLGVHQHLVAGQRVDGLLPLRGVVRLVHRHGLGHRLGVGRRELRVSRPRHQLDLDARRSGREHLQLVGRPRRAGDQERHRHQQRRTGLGERAVHADGRRHRSERRDRHLRRRQHQRDDRQRLVHHRDGRRLGRRDPVAPARVGHADREHLRVLRLVRDRLRRHQPDLAVQRHRDRGQLLQVPVRRVGQRGQHAHGDQCERREGDPALRHHGQRHGWAAELLPAGRERGLQRRDDRDHRRHAPEPQR